MYCAQCHGQSGDGNGLIELDRPARSFVDGGFSFGNTVEAIKKTTRSGIPGTPMPPFKDLLTEEEVQKVVTHVRSFAPEQPEPLRNETEMVVTNTPVVVRGMIPPIHEDAELHPRGLLIGNPDGFSYEYRVDDVRLLAIRQGKFVERTDWTGRGGSPLKPLGNVVVLVDRGTPTGLFKTNDNKPLRAKLLSTNVSGALGSIRYALVDSGGAEYALITETCQPTTGVRTLVEQTLHIDASRPFVLEIPNSTMMDSDPTVQKGTHVRTIIHASKERE